MGGGGVRQVGLWLLTTTAVLLTATAPYVADITIRSVWRDVVDITSVTLGSWGRALYSTLRPAPQPETVYDMILDVTSLFKLSKDTPDGDTGWNVYMNNNTSWKELQGEFDGRYAALYGLYNSGKTFILNMLLNFGLPAGNTLHTKGVSVKTATDKYKKSVVFLDTAGSQEPVPWNGDKIDRHATDVFLKQVLMNMAHVMLVVVNQLTQADQETIIAMRQDLPADVELFVLHNFKDANALDEVQLRVQSDVVKAWNAKRHEIPLKHGDEVLYKSFVGSTNLPMKHFIFAKKGSAAGNYWNDRTCTLLMNQLVADIKLQSKLKIVENFMEVSQRLLPYFFESDIVIPVCPCACIHFEV
eukprot:TRINITY_DN1984_c1_g1_i2.p1 TRINITY_DN1984_c1_g1~~TRINITY_DN1984_c1_g1_i2.p1  ORF type:complete len:372 (+),score=106.03 TRINITY_DN1984_c1_g1_i2:46-1116(+)